ncbi:hypothetical protein Ahy_A01g000371 [Arachis hypogaea]|uniref:Uncharacterized protein n=1 Tax=Arachis hypogaea TaxID=3818 RepID=A0A445EK14_ARAHY|nr:hypothetical protein Ahy_A01g000371 [Arachis hypogaea]
MHTHLASMQSMRRPVESMQRCLHRCNLAENSNFSFKDTFASMQNLLLTVFMSVVPDLDDRQSQTKWTMNLTWFHNTVCGELEQDATEERLLRNTRGYIMQLIGGILFPDASDSQVHIRWLPLLEDLETCG